MEFYAWHVAPPCAVGLAWVVWARERARRFRAERAAVALRQSQESTLRLLRMSTGDQRNLALTLIGHAEALQPADPSLTGLARRLLEMSDTLVEHTEAPQTARFLSDEPLDLQGAIQFAVAQVVAHLGPSRRAWRIDPSFGEITLQADKRALNQVLVSVLTAAASATRHADWIELSPVSEESSLCIVVQDEGTGLPVTTTHAFPEESRGIGLRLTLARSLMQAHGGSLTVQSAECVGTRVHLRFPAARMLQRLPYATAGQTAAQD